MMSGSALSPWSMSTPASTVKYSQELARALNCPIEHKGFKKMVECLRRQKLDDILNHEPIGPTFLSTFGPTIDGIILPSDLIGSMSFFDPLGGGTGYVNRGQFLLHYFHSKRALLVTKEWNLSAVRNFFLNDLKNGRMRKQSFFKVRWFYSYELYDRFLESKNVRR